MEAIELIERSGVTRGLPIGRDELRIGRGLPSEPSVWLHETQLSRDANIKESRLFMYILNNSDILFRFG